MKIRMSNQGRFIPKFVQSVDTTAELARKHLCQVNLNWNDGHDDRVQFLREQAELLIQGTKSEWIRNRFERRVHDIADSHTAYEFLKENFAQAGVSSSGEFNHSWIVPKTYISVVQRLAGVEPFFVPKA